MTMCAENKTTMNINTNEILRKDVKVEHYNKTGEQRLDKRHISKDRFKAYMSNEESDLSTAEFSLTLINTALFYYNLPWGGRNHHPPSNRPKT